MDMANLHRLQCFFEIHYNNIERRKIRAGSAMPTVGDNILFRIINGRAKTNCTKFVCLLVACSNVLAVFCYF